MTRKVARAVPAGRRWGGQGWEQEVAGRRWKVERDQILEHSGLRHLTAGPRFGSAQAAMGGPTGFRTQWRHPLLPPTYVFAGIRGDVSAYVGALSFSLFAGFFFPPWREDFFFSL